MNIRLTAAVVLLGAAAHADTTFEHGKRIVDQAIQALGGNNFLTVRNRVESGRAYSFYREKLTGLAVATIYTEYVPSSNPQELAVREREAFFTKPGKKNEEYAVLFTDKDGYTLTWRGARPIEKDVFPRYTETTRRNFFYIARIRLNEPGMTFEWKSSDVVDNRPVDIVDITDADNLTTTVYFDQTTKLPNRQVFSRMDPDSRDRFEEVTIFSKYRDAGDGVMWPYDIQRLRDGGIIFQIYSDSVKVNEDLSGNLFVLPSDVKILNRE